MFWVTGKDANGRNVSAKVATRTAVWRLKANMAADPRIAQFRVRTANADARGHLAWEDVTGQF
jgi:hypothetical protein